MAPSNKAAFSPEPKANPLTVAEVPYPTISDDEIIVKVAAAALNPVDWYIQLMANDVFPWLQYPYTGGSDAAGTVVEVGSKVSRFKIGDRVLGLAAGFESRSGAFQEYVVLEPKVVAPIPDDLSFTDAAVVPLGLSTAACGLYQKDFLALEYPSVNPKPSGKTLLVWGGASSVGTNAIQLAVASGYEVITTSSPKNFEYCKMLGASLVFDYHSENLTQELLDAFKGKVCAGGFACQPGTEKIVFQIVAESKGGKFVACASRLREDVPEGIAAKFIFGSTLKDNEVGDVIFTDFLPAVLAQNKFKCLPEPLLVGHGLEKLQEGFDQGKSGQISARKLVITI